MSDLASGKNETAACHELWEGLHHQGDVGEAWYAAVPHPVHIYRHRDALDWNTYAIVAVIELARDHEKNPKSVAWLKDDDLASIHRLAEIGAREILRAKNDDEASRNLSQLGRRGMNVVRIGSCEIVSRAEVV